MSSVREVAAHVIASPSRQHLASYLGVQRPRSLNTDVTGMNARLSVLQLPWLRPTAPRGTGVSMPEPSPPRIVFAPAQTHCTGQRPVDQAPA